MVRASRRMRVRPASSFTRWARQSIRAISLSRAAEGRNDFGAERLGSPAPHALDGGELLDGARRGLGNLADDAVRQQHTGLEPEALRGTRTPLTQHVDAPTHRAGNARARPIWPLGQLTSGSARARSRPP